MANGFHGEYLENTASASSMLSLAVQMLAHDARRPFSLLRVVISKLKRSTSIGEMHAVCEQMLPRIDRSVSHVEAMVQDILEFGRVMPRINETEINLVQILDSAIKQCVEIESDLVQEIELTCTECHLIEGDQHKLQRAFSNVISNALEASASKGRVWVHVTSQGGHVEVRIGNTGSYIEPKNRKRIFESFYTSGKVSGTGLGLTIAREVMLAHGGAIECTSRRDDVFPDGCTEFVLRLPVSLPLERLQCSAAGPQATEALEAVDQILLVEDDPFIAQDWVDYFNGRFLVRVVRDPGFLLEKLELELEFFSNFRLVVTDRYFADHEVDGLTLAAEIRSKLPDMPIYLSTDSLGDFRPDTTVISGRIDKLPWTLEKSLIGCKNSNNS
jgi:anti-sigma regulatory factor (Ser/Thr protein kinase)/CheY-like chemotaxis protein